MMKLADQSRGTLNKLGRLPSTSRYRVTLPMDMVEEFTTGHFGIKDGFDFELLFSSNDEWRERFGCPTRDRTVSSRKRSRRPTWKIG